LRATTGLYAKGLNIKFAVDSLVSDVTAVEIDEDKPIDEEKHVKHDEERQNNMKLEKLLYFLFGTEDFSAL